MRRQKDDPQRMRQGEGSRNWVTPPECQSGHPKARATVLPIVKPADAPHSSNVTSEALCHGLLSNSIERFPTEVGIRKQTEDFKAITFKNK